MFRQGDVLLIPIESSEVILGEYVRKARRHRKLNGLVLAEGEATGHHHRVMQNGRTTARIRIGRVKTTRTNARVLVVPKGGAELVHDEHQTIKLPAGKFLVQTQREFVPPTPAERKSISRPVYD